MKKVYKTMIFTLMLCLSMSLLKAQEVPVPPKVPEKPEIPAPPAPPKFDEQAWKDWGENFKKSFDEKKWKEWGEKAGKSFEGFDQQFEGMNLASADFDKKMEKLNAKLKDLKIPELPAMPEIPAMPPMPPIPEINIPSEAFINNGWTLGAPEDAVEKTKKLTKTYPADANDQLAISNSYGKITVNTWDKNEIKVDVEIKAYAESDDDAQKLLDGVSIDNSKQGNLLKFITNFGRTNRNNSWLSTSFWRGGDSKQKVEVYYTVYMPSKNTLNLKTNYTNIVLPDFNGAVGINMNYGDLNTGKLDGLIYKISSNYSKMKIEYINNAEVFCNYGDLEVNKAKNLKVSCNYTHVNISSLSEDNSIKMNYGDFQLNSLDKNFKTLNLTSNYLQSKFDFAGSPNFNFDISTSNSSFKYDDSKVIITGKTPSDEDKGWSSSKNYKGYYGKSSSANINIKSNYGGVKFN